MSKPAALQILGSVILAFACSCAVGPNYRKPTVNVPPVRGVAPEEAAPGAKPDRLPTRSGGKFSRMNS
jgi:hypothetical protein